MAVVVSLLEEDLPRLRDAVRRQASRADVVELRLDRIGAPDEASLAGLIASCPRPVIATVHGAEGFGDFCGEEEERLEILRRAARAGAAYVDVDWRLAGALGAVEPPCRRIVSRHEPRWRAADLGAMLAEIRGAGAEGDLLKLVPHAACAEEGLEVMRFLAGRRGELVAFASGEAGSFTRTLARILGSPFTYAAPAAVPGEPPGGATAPGQLRLDELAAIAPAGGIGPGTGVYGVVGRPAGHSLSPALFAAAFEAARLDAVYLAFEPEDFGSFLDLAAELGVAGLSVTAPFKEPARALALEVDGRSEASGAVNTLVREGTGWRGSNTDVGAVRGALEAGLARHEERVGGLAPLEELAVLVVGAGGAARAAALAVRELGARLLVTARREERAGALAAELGGLAVPGREVGRTPHRALVQCTPAGSRAQPGRLPLAEDALRERICVVESVYRPLETPLLRLARARGCTAVDGGEWFVRQAREQLRRFASLDADEALLRRAFERGLGDRDG